MYSLLLLYQKVNEDMTVTLDSIIISFISGASYIMLMEKKKDDIYGEIKELFYNYCARTAQTLQV